MNVQEKNLTASQLHKRKNEKQISPQKPKLNYLTHTHTHKSNPTYFRAPGNNDY